MNIVSLFTTLFTSLILSAAPAQQSAGGLIPRAEDCYFSQPEDTLVINQLLNELIASGKNREERIVMAAAYFKDKPYTAKTLEIEGEPLVINAHEFDCLTLVETAFAATIASEFPRADWHDFAKALTSLRYRDGKRDGYASRLHYSADWISDNAFRGNVADVSSDIGRPVNITKTLDWMTKHAGDYPALKDSATLERIKRLEMGFRGVRYPCLKKQVASQKSAMKNVHDGDMVIFLSNRPGIDSSHVGILRMKDGLPYLIHASMAMKKVMVEETPLSDYLNKYKKDAPGFRIVRLLP